MLNRIVQYGSTREVLQDCFTWRQLLMETISSIYDFVIKSVDKNIETTELHRYIKYVICWNLQFFADQLTNNVVRDAEQLLNHVKYLLNTKLEQVTCDYKPHNWLLNHSVGY